MSDTSQQVEQEQEPEVEQQEVEQPSEFNDAESELEKIVAQRKADKKRERAEAEQNANRRPSAAQDAAQDSSTETIVPEDGATQPTVETPAPELTESVSAGQEGSEPPSTTPQSDTPPFTYRWRDTDFDEPTVQSGLELKAWSDSLPEQAKVGINYYLSGSHVLVERSEYERIQKGQPTPESKPDTDLDSLSDEDLADLSPAVVSTIKTQQQQLAEMVEWRKQQEDLTRQQQLTQQQQYIRSSIDKVTSAIKSKYQLNDEEFKQLDDLTGNSGMVPRLYAATGDAERALNEAFEMTYQRHFFARELSRLQPAQEQVTAAKNKVTTRKANAASLNPAGNSVPSGTKQPSTEAERRAARVADIAEMMTQG